MTTSPGIDDGASFGDARGCRQWLGAIVLTSIPQAQAAVLEGVRRLNAREFDPLERLKSLELLRDKVAFLQGEQRRRYAGKTLPLSPNDNAAWNTGAALLEAMEEGYRRCAADAGEAGPLAAHRALIAHRALRYVGALMHFHALAYRSFAPALWSRLHAHYLEAERQGVALERVKDSLEGEEGVSSVFEAYVRALLLQAAAPYDLVSTQVDFADALLAAWSRKVRWAEAAAAAEAAVLVVDAASEAGVRAAHASEVRPTERALDVQALSHSLRKRIHGLERNEEPAKLGLPAQAAGVDALAQLRRLHRLWCEGAAARAPGKASEVKTAGLVFTLAEIHFFVSGGKAFEPPERELTQEEKQDIEVFGRVTERTHGRMMVEHNYAVEPWSVVEEMPGVWRLQRPASAAKGVAVGRLAAIRFAETGPFYLATVAGVRQEMDGRIEATFALFPGRPEPIIVRGTDARQRPTPWMQAFRLPALERLQIPASIVVAPGIAGRGRAIEIWETSRPATVQQVLDRGADFDRVVVA